MIDKRYIFSANAVGAAANIHRIDSTTGLNYMPLAAAHSSLPSTGGFAEASEGEYSYSVDAPRKLQILSVKKSESSTEGKPSGDGHVSYVHCRVQGYSLIEQVAADDIEARLDLEQLVDDPFPSIRPNGCRLVNLTIEGYGLNVELDESIFQDCPTKDSLRKRFESDPVLRTKYAWRFSAEPGALTIPEYKGYFVCSLVRDLQWVKEPHPDVTIDGYTLQWANFGKLYLGEVLIKEDSRYLSILRAKMGSPADGSGSGGSVDSQGASVP